MKFTKKIKENWLAALRSGEYEQFGENLYNIDNLRQSCCLNVLAVQLKIETKPTNTGGTCIIDGIDVKYQPFKDLFGKREDEIFFRYNDLAEVNDSSYLKGVRDYSQVIPLIEELETVEE